MFFIMGISQGRKELPFSQLLVCTRCGQYGNVKIFMTYTYLSLFFIPVFRWNRRYFAQMSCCGNTVELSKELGSAIRKGTVTSLPSDVFSSSGDFHGSGYRASQYDNSNPDDPAGSSGGNPTGRRKTCKYCGYSTTEEFGFCPKCGKPLDWDKDE